MNDNKKETVGLRLLWGKEEKGEYDDVEIYKKDFEYMVSMALKENKSIEDKFLEIIQGMVEKEEKGNKTKEE